jgi:amino acid adenylation domain-containing protein/thioester reductase-like protein
MALVRAVGENMPSMVRGKIPTLQIMTENDMLNRLYKEGLDFADAGHSVSILMDQLSHRYPYLNVLEIGAGTGGTTKHVLGAASKHLRSYTFTDISPGFFENAQSLFSEYSGKMVYKVLDIEQDVVEQGFEENSYDLVVASNVLHATKFLLNTLKNCRRLLRPGGYLLLMEVTSQSILTGFIMSGLPGWWLGKDDGRKYLPTVNEARWNSVLLDSGFSGVDTSITNEKGINSVMISQAVDDRVDFLREPLKMAYPLPQFSSIVVVGGNTSDTAEIAHETLKLLEPFAQNVSIVTRLENLASKTSISPGAAIICLSDIDEPAWKDMTDQRFKGMQNMILSSKYLIWITRRRRDAEPLSNMLVGVGRTVLLESPHIALQFLDIDDLHTHMPEPAIFAEALLRVASLALPEFETVLWSSEHELTIENGRLYVPRMLPDQILNDRLNSGRRLITEDASPVDRAVEIVYDDGFFVPQEMPMSVHRNHCDDNFQSLHVEATSLFPLIISEGEKLFICVGAMIPSGSRAIALSPTCSSVVVVHSTNIFPLHGCHDGAQIVHEMLRALMVETLMMDVREGCLWVHNADSEFTDILVKRAASQGCKLFTSTSESASDNRHTFIHPLITERSLLSLIPSDVRIFVNMDTQNTHHLDLVRSCFKSSVEVVEWVVEDSLSIHLDINTLRETINQQALLDRTVNKNPAIENEKIIHADQLLLKQTTLNLNSMDAVVCWAGISSMPIRVQPIDAKSLFSGDKTYFLVGLTGEVGLSLCSWMATNGARHIAITSRNPAVDIANVEDFQKQGLNLRIFSMDISNKTELRQVYEEICRTMPPIAGVANAAMVLHDTPFDNSSLDLFNMVLRPKVTGSINLDELFFSVDLEFFVLFSSLASVIGTKGQANYSAANMFMHSLANQRRNRGLAASVIDIPILLGIGYVSRSAGQYETRLKNYSFMTISETDFHNVFASAIVVGQPDSGHQPGLVVGLKPSSKADWSHQPRFAHISYDEEAIEERLDKKQQPGSSQNVQERLMTAENTQIALAIIEASFARKLELILQVPAEKIDPKVPLLQLGIDSLVAVEIRSWFLKEINVDMPVLKVLSGATLSELCQDALPRIMDSQRSMPGDQDLNKDPEETSSTSASYSSSITSQSVTTNMESPPPVRPEYIDIIPGKDVAVGDQSRIKDISSPYERLDEMSAAQARLYFLHQYLDDKATYNVILLGKINDRFDIPRLQRAVQRVADKHESLRSCFFIDNASGKAIQAVNRRHNIPMVHKTIEFDTEVQAEVEELKLLHFDIESGQTMRVHVLSLSSTTHYVIFCYHHIIIDGVSWVLFIEDLDHAFAGRELGSSIGRQAIDFSRMQRTEYAPRSLKDELRYWSDRYKTLPEVLPLFPWSKSKCRKILRTYDTEEYGIVLDKSWARKIKSTSSRIQTTSFHYYLGALAGLIHRYLGITDFTIGMLDANRTHPRYLKTVGYFLNLLPIRFQMDPSMPFDDFIRQTRDNVYTSIANSRLQYDAILDHLDVSRSGNQNPLFQIVINYRMIPSAHSPLGSNMIEWMPGVVGKNPYDLIVDITETPELTQICFTTQKYLYSSVDSKMMLHQYIHTLDNLRAATSVPIIQCPLWNAAEIKKAIEVGRGHRTTVEWEDTVAHRIERMAAEFADETAIKDGKGTKLTYSELMERSQVISKSLHERELSPGAYIAVLLTPVADVVASIMAILRLGLVYVPLDTRNPLGRLERIVSDCRPSIIICHSETETQAQVLASHDMTVLNLSTIVKSSETPLTTPILAQLDDPGFAIYTSGSTGNPKGVLLTHRGIMNQIWSISKLFGVGREVVLQQSSFGFDLALEQILVPLTNGGILIMAPAESRGDPIRIASLILSEGITYTELVPSEYLSLLRYGSEILRECKSWRFAFSGGEKVTTQLKRGFRQLGLANLQLVNLYGPAEASLSCTRGEVAYRSEADDNPESDGYSGSAMPNYSIIIVDQNLQPLPTGIPGEICIGGAGTAIGYVNRAEETAEKFISNPFASKEDVSSGWTTLYRSGDKGRIMEDGSLQFLGRLDGASQIKIHGIRIELDEITNVILATAGSSINDAVVSWRVDSGLLVAFVVYAATFDGDTDAYSEQLKSRLPLPSYMCPTYIITIDQIPRNPNGKKDRTAIDALPVPESEIIDALDGFSDIEAQVKSIWEEVLGAKARSFKMKPDTDFFHVGGNSLLLIRLQAAVRSAFGITISLPELFQASTIGSMASRIQMKATTEPLLDDFNWNQEISALLDVSSVLQSPITRIRPTERDTKLEILLTGATGFLGRHLLRLLVDDHRVQAVHCVAIRPHPDGSPRQTGIRDKKIVEYMGNLSEPLLGLKTSAFEKLAEHVDVIIHNGADVSFLKTYRSLRRPNVVSMRSLIEMAIPRSIPIHFISTAGVAHFSTQQPVHEVSLSSSLPQSEDATINGYASSKWVAEVLLEKAAQEHKLSAYIHRPTTITGEDSPDDNILSSILRYSTLLRAFPKAMRAVHGPLDFVGVDDVSSNIVKSLLHRQEDQPRTTYMHHCSDTKIPASQFGYYLKTTYGGEFEELETADWLDRARREGIPEAIYEYLSALNTDKAMKLPHICRAGTDSG